MLCHDKLHGLTQNKTVISDFILRPRTPGPLTGRQWALPSAQYEMIFTPLEIMPRSPARFRVVTTGISNGVNLSGKHKYLGCFHFSDNFLNSRLTGSEVSSLKKLALSSEAEKEKHMNEPVILEIFSDYV